MENECLSFSFGYRETDTSLNENMKMTESAGSTHCQQLCNSESICSLGVALLNVSAFLSVPLNVAVTQSAAHSGALT